MTPSHEGWSRLPYGPTKIDCLFGLSNQDTTSLILLYLVLMLFKREFNDNCGALSLRRFYYELPPMQLNNIKG